MTIYKINDITKVVISPTIRKKWQKLAWESIDRDAEGKITEDWMDIVKWINPVFPMSNATFADYDTLYPNLFAKIVEFAKNNHIVMATEEKGNAMTGILIEMFNTIHSQKKMMDGLLCKKSQSEDDLEIQIINSASVDTDHIISIDDFANTTITLCESEDE